MCAVFFSSRRRHTRFKCDWSSDVCSSDLHKIPQGTAVVALCSDAGGSIRQLAGFCGVVGVTPTYGRVSRYGLTAFASSLDHIGPFGRTVRDAALLLQSIAGRDECDATSAFAPLPDYLAQLDGNVKGKKLGLPREYFADLSSESAEPMLKGE